MCRIDHLLYSPSMTGSVEKKNDCDDNSNNVNDNDKDMYKQCENKT